MILWSANFLLICMPISYQAVTINFSSRSLKILFYSISFSIFLIIWSFSTTLACASALPHDADAFLRSSIIALALLRNFYLYSPTPVLMLLFLTWILQAVILIYWCGQCLSDQLWVLMYSVVQEFVFLLIASPAPHRRRKGGG